MKTTENKLKSTSPVLVLAIVATCNISAGLFFALARQPDWTLGSIYRGLFVAHCLICLACVLLWNPVLIERRLIGGPGTKTWDKVWIVVLIGILVSIYVVAMNDLNTRDENPRPTGIMWLIGVAMFVFGWTILTWSMVTNPFFEKMVRIQTEHGHRVIDNGPYATIRHPGYVGFSALLLSTPLLLASAPTFLPALLAAVGFVIRTALEDRTLQAELSGYAEYATRVRFRLIPAVW